MSRLRTETLRNILTATPQLGSDELCSRLGGINRSTFMRLIHSLGDHVISRGRARRTRYALRRTLKDSESSFPLFSIDENGDGHELGVLDLVAPLGSALLFNAPFPWPLDPSMIDGWFDGLPYPVVDMRPQGFLGRNFAKQHAAQLGVSDDPERWSDNDILRILVEWGYDQPGNLILGEEAYRRYLEYRRSGNIEFLGDQAIETAYPALAEAALAYGVVGSSAGGEFPKFTAKRQSLAGKFDVIVKFSGADDSPAVRRWSDLLICEHLALETLRKFLAIPAAISTIHQFAGRTFLEVVRFDRVGEFGRSGVCTLGSLNAALLGCGLVSWPKLALALQQAGWLTTADVAAIERTWWFGKLIANSDMHEGNLAFLPGLKLAPIYDMLPMRYAPLRGGEVPPCTFAPDFPLPSESTAWSEAANAAQNFWQRCADEPRISAGFRAVCAENAAILQHLREC